MSEWTEESRKMLARAERAIDAARRRASRRHKAGKPGAQEAGWRLEEIQLVVGYAEPGYGHPESDDVIAFGNWNDISRWNRDTRKSESLDSTMKQMADAFEKMGIAIEWNDEWTICSLCGRAVRTQADSYGWTRSYTELDGEVYCEDCTLEDPEAYLESLEDNPNNAVTLGIDPEGHGYTRLEGDFEHGFHPGQAADPHRIAKALRGAGISRFIFRIDDVGQFDTRFSVFVHDDDMEEHGIDADFLSDKRTDADISPAQAMEKALRSIPGVKPPADGGVVFHAIQGDGTVKTSIVSLEDFINGNIPR